MNVEYTTNGTTWSILTGVSSQQFGSVIMPIPLVKWQNKVLTLAASLTDCVIDANLSTKSLITYDTVTSKWINCNNIPISAVNANWNIMNKGVSGAFDLLTFQYGGADKASIDNTGKITATSLTGNNFYIANNEIRLNANSGPKWDIGIYNNDILRFNPDYRDVVSFSRDGAITSYALNNAGNYGLVCAGVSENSPLQNAGMGAYGQVMISQGTSKLPIWQNNNILSSSLIGYVINVDFTNSGGIYSYALNMFYSAYAVHIGNLANTQNVILYLPNSLSNNADYMYIQVFGTNGSYINSIKNLNYNRIYYPPSGGYAGGEIGFPYYVTHTYKLTYYLANMNDQDYTYSSPSWKMEDMGTGFYIPLVPNKACYMINSKNLAFTASFAVPIVTLGSHFYITDIGGNLNKSTMTLYGANGVTILGGASSLINGNRHFINGINDIVSMN